MIGYSCSDEPILYKPEPRAGHIEITQLCRKSHTILRLSWDGRCFLFVVEDRETPAVRTSAASFVARLIWLGSGNVGHAAC